MFRHSMYKSQLRFPTKEFEKAVPEPEVWRPIHYLGSKLRLVGALRVAIDRVDPSGGTICDLFSGSGTVSAALATCRDVVAVDIQEYSRVLCSAVLMPPVISDAEARTFVELAGGAEHAKRLSAASPLIEYETLCMGKARQGNLEPLCELIEHASMVAFLRRGQPPVSAALQRAHMRTHRALTGKNVVLRHFGGLYFSYKQAVELDSLLTAAHAEQEGRRDCLLAAIISMASDIANTVGKHFAQPIRPRSSDGKPKPHLIAKILRDRELDLGPTFWTWLGRYRSLKSTGRQHQVIRADYADALASLNRKVAVVYADPPYTRDHYSRFYHVLETMALWDDPAVSTTKIHSDGETLSRGMYRAERHQSPFCIKSQAPEAFKKLFAGVRDLHAPLILSYSPYATDGTAHPRVMTIDQLSALAAKYFCRVEKVSAGRISHMKLNATRLHIEASSEAELIFVCT